jgi:hypothetical protein
MRFVAVAGLVTTLMAVAADRAAADVTPQRRWQQIQAPHFRVIGDAAERDLRRVAERMEQLHALVGMLAPETTAGVPDTTVIVFRDRRAYLPFQPIYDGAAQPVAGYFAGGPMNYITLLAVAEGESQSVVHHEYVHLAMDRAVGQMPAWIGEGLAEFYSTFDVTDGGRTAQLGGMLQHHLWTLQKTLLPLATLAAVDHGSPYYNERDKSSVFYAESWALVHYLQLGKERKYAAKFAPFLSAIADGVPFARACSTVLGVAAEVLEQELRNYVFSPVLYRAAIPLPDRISRMERITASVVPEAEVHAVLGDLLHRLDGRPAAREHLEHALGLDGGQALALAALARVEAGAGQSARARDLALRTPTSPTHLTEYYRAEALEQVAATPETDAAAIEAALRSAIARHPSFAPALAALARRLAGVVAGRGEALQLIGQAITFAPSREDYVLQQARVYLLTGDTKTARTRLGPLLARGSTPQIKAAARELMGHAARLETAALENAASPELPPASPASGPDAGNASSPAPDASNEFVPDLRPVGANETRVAGTLGVIECGRDGVVVTITVDGAPLKVRATAFSAVDFVTYRNDLKGSIACGPQPAMPVLVTYQPGKDATTAGVVVAIEYLPAGYKLPGR